MSAVAVDPTINRQVLAAARATLSEDPQASVADISRRAGISRATFYRHFGSRARLLESVAHEPRPDARTRILSAAQDMLLRESLAHMSMDELARAADVSRGTLYRIFPGKVALMDALISEYSPLESVRQVVIGHRDEPPDVVLPLVADAIVGTAGVRLGLMRAMFVEVSSGSETTLAGIRHNFAATIAVLAEYLESQMRAGRLRTMQPITAIQAFVGPIFFHLLARPVIDRLTGMPTDPSAAVDQLVRVTLDGFAPSRP
jgi:AcrR family transcriptional regulator